MAATQAEPHQNDVNRDLNQQEQTPLSANNSLQNGTDKSSGGRVVVGSEVGGGKALKPVQNISVDMSQYRQESGPPVNNSEQNSNNSDDGTGKINNSDKQFSHNSEQSGGEVNYGKGAQDGGQNMQGYGMAFPQRGGYMHPEAGNPMHVGGGDAVHQQTNSYGHFNPNMRHAAQAKPMRPSAPAPPAPQPPAPPFPSHQQRFLPGQSISPPTGPTPTLNQLLQSSNSVHRYQNSYSEYGMQKPGEQPQPGGMPVYNQSWPPPRPMPPYPPQQQPPAAYRNPPPVSTFIVPIYCA
ncbi:hypothetical protein AAG570_008528 [Ranatra chinensis]|uniref:Uncharacterized protein n=1 Tax=Ranatra chinensis TaxID=642074 RepID=A0ABD0YR54_9HEMI